MKRPTFHWVFPPYHPEVLNCQQSSGKLGTYGKPALALTPALGLGNHVSCTLAHHLGDV